MKSVLTIATGLYLVISVGHSAVMVERNGVLWEGTFEGDTVNLTVEGTPPVGTIPVWSIFDSNGYANTSVTDGVYKLISGSLAVTGSYQNNTFLGTGNLMTVEWLARVDDVAPESIDGSAGLVLFANASVLAFNLLKDAIVVYELGAEKGRYDLDGTEFNLARVTYDGTLATDRWKLYVNNELAWSSGTVNGGSAGPENRVAFGDYSSGGMYGTSYWDYISWTAEGAYAPVPEPSHSAILGFMGLGVWLFARRKLAA